MVMVTTKTHTCSGYRKEEEVVYSSGHGEAFGREAATVQASKQSSNFSRRRLGMQTSQEDSRGSKCLRQDSPGVGVRTQRRAEEEGPSQNLTWLFSVTSGSFSSSAA